MDYQEWIPLLGLPADDERVIARLAAHDWNTPVVFEPQELTFDVVFRSHGMNIGFESEYKLSSDGVVDLPILASVTMKPTLSKNDKKWKWTAYSGPMPYSLKGTCSKADVIALLGEPANFDDDFNFAGWLLEDGQRELGI